MATATLTPHPVPTPSGATAASGVRHSHPLGTALRAVRVFAGAAFSVVVLGETETRR
ncbi:hypothetical protein [Streptomyces sp. VRA16 Mangrove soil]|uniref:hypothetical protein n=1 Tax=Streptomyces sp. VRA16 Mangrove soil TaxID=2817434 RepID=UPI001A9DC08A|nr:hypothetical protein [Streptomyces sp. VRA16 Mangrove soil]MBO1337879.1 hypothetical protein [Streptomyces sp. VRA16 Mangrove soil]